MAQLHLCGGCKGLVPAAARRCPHCARALTPPALRWARTLATAAGSGVAAMTLMACYGVPCASSGGCIETGTGTELPTDDGGDGGGVQNYQYCNDPDAGLYPCWPDGGAVNLESGAPDAGDGGDLDGGASDAG